jgi:3-methyladenine DNA glycosylase AlkD
MGQAREPGNVAAFADRIEAELRALPVQNARNVRALRRKYSRELRHAEARYVLRLAGELLARRDCRWMAYDLIGCHKGAFGALGPADVERLGRGIDSWGSVDAFARIIAGPVWLNGQLPDSVIHRWARSDDRWWRRAALVGTVALNMRSQGGPGDAPRTLAVCRVLLADRDDMVVKAMSWALRALAVREPDAVRRFLADHDEVLAARAKREVRNKLATGLKNPRRRRD